MDVQTIPWLQLGVGGGLAAFQAYLLWRLIVVIQPASETRWQAAFGGLQTKIEELVVKQDQAMGELTQRFENMDRERRAEAREIMAGHRQELADKRHEFLDALQAQQKQWLQVWADVRKFQSGQLPPEPEMKGK
jgi:hypothetical protein